MTRIFFFLLGFGLMVIGFVYIILYLNMLYTGYNFTDFIHYIIGRCECYFPLVGLIIMNLSIYIKGERKYGLYL